MTVIMGYMGKIDYYIASDSEVTDSHSPVAMEGGKIYGFKDFMIGATGRLKAGKSLEYWKPPKRKLGESLDHYIKTSVVKSLGKRLRDYEVMGKKNDIPDFDESETSFLIVCSEGIYRIGYDLSCYKLQRRYDAIGCGMDVALGVLGLSWDYDVCTDEVNILREALHLAAEHINGVNDDFHFIKRSY